ncbi:hypothetical protein C4578_01830 [Candidatus Microgenomates bacterium]|jgi:16S rRNA (adenine1518-N6/adenine1519-N6)-dimethyltransferase|nr:MAG: hypothetical protein C4578_01830 [Candidatus Microgenomates bacterium]
MELDQYFLKNKELAKKLVEVARVGKEDIVLEIGAGKGFITEEIAKKAGKVIAVEIDRGFEGVLRKIPGNVELVFGDINNVLEERVKFNKVVANPPSSLVEPLVRKFINKDFEVMSFLLPLKFFQKLKSPFFTVYYDSSLVSEVDKDSFSPAPGTKWAIVKITKKEEPLKSKEWERYIRKYLYEHSSAKLKNALMEAFVRIYQSRGKRCTKNQARRIVLNLGFFSESPPEEKDIPEIAQKAGNYLSI